MDRWRTSFSRLQARNKSYGDFSSTYIRSRRLRAEYRVAIKCHVLLCMYVQTGIC